MNALWRGAAILSSAGLIFAASPCRAGGSLFVDDAGIAANAHCQLESWLRPFQSEVVELTTVPACSSENIEWSLGVTRLSTPVRSIFTPGIKWQLKGNDDGGFGIALAATSIFHDGRSQGTTLYAAPTWLFGQHHEWELDTNVGEYDQPGERTHGLAGAGLHYSPSAKVTLIAEQVWREAHGHVSQAGMRLNLSRATTVDFLVGRSKDRTSSRWATVGVNLSF